MDCALQETVKETFALNSHVGIRTTDVQVWTDVLHSF